METVGKRRAEREEERGKTEGEKAGFIDRLFVHSSAGLSFFYVSIFISRTKSEQRKEIKLESLFALFTIVDQDSNCSPSNVSGLCQNYVYVTAFFVWQIFSQFCALFLSPIRERAYSERTFVPRTPRNRPFLIIRMTRFGLS